MVTVSCVTFDCTEPGPVADFWAAALGWTRNGDRVEAPDGSTYLEFVAVHEPKTVKNRLHLGLNTQDLDEEIERLPGLGASPRGKRSSRRSGRTETWCCAIRKATSSVWGTDRAVAIPTARSRI